SSCSPRRGAGHKPAAPVEPVRSLPGTPQTMRGFLDSWRNPETVLAKVYPAAALHRPGCLLNTRRRRFHTTHPRKLPQPYNSRAMPELPEVESVRRSLLRHLPGRTITAVKLLRPDIVTGPATP